ncbi:MAG: 1-acyl-sn-glycerol-3-phosphate acyltransferase [Gammaproteobacteria bacterium]|nr:MAG: 1-acyl-sn-glycerol-3-phosphate acyltransferase [Gammaproteobacteria bacterium]
MNALRFPFRVTAVLAWILAGVMWATTLSVRERLLRQTVRRDTAARSWLKGLLRVLDVRVHALGRLPEVESALIVANHISWLDIPVLGASRPLHFLSKIEVRQWPVIGWLAARAGTLFIRRGGGQVQAIRQAIQRQLSRGRTVVIFPEGTTTRGDDVRRFHPRLFQAAVDAGQPVIPVTLHYRREGVIDSLAPFVGEDDFFTHLMRLLLAPATDVYVSWGEPLRSDSAAGLADQAHAFCRSTLQQLNWLPTDGGLESVADRFA